MTNWFRFFVLVALFSFLSGCLRFVPPRSDIEKRTNRADAEGAGIEGQLVHTSEIAGPDAFYAHEQQLRREFLSLVEERSSLIQAQSFYTIGTGDLIQISVFGLPDLDTTMRVTPEGKVAIDLVGDIQAAGLTEAGFRDELRDKLKPFVRKPQIQVFISEYRGHRISVIGEVSKPGVYNLQHQNYQLLDLLSEAGGRTEEASGRILLIPAVRTAGQFDRNQKQWAAQFEHPGLRNAHMAWERPGIEIKIDDLFGSSNNPPVVVPLQAGDTIIVPEAGSFEVDGEVKTPGSYELAAKTSLLGGIAAGGGLTYSADVEQVELIRDIGSGKRAAITLNLEESVVGAGDDVRLRDGDVIRVPSARGRFIGRQIVDFINGLVNVGVRG